MGGEDMEVFRWYIARLDEDQAKSGGQASEVHVGILPTAKEGKQQLRSMSVESIAELETDNLDWWGNEDAELEGHTTTEVLLQAVVERNARPLSESDRQRASARGIVEEMVLLQLVSDTSGWSRLWEKLSATDGLPNVTELVEVESKWLDFTRQAREMARHIYRNVLGGGEESA
jgi:hypothetical protein